MREIGLQRIWISNQQLDLRNIAGSSNGYVVIARKNKYRDENFAGVGWHSFGSTLQI